VPRLTPHFRTEEFDCRDGTPVPIFAYGQLDELAGQLLEPLRRQWGPVTILSGYRTRQHNAAVGGAPHSFHVYQRGRQGVAADIRCARGRPADWYRFLDGRGAGGLERASDHVHVDTRAKRARF
jgi:uncharacterized protein YcbK (DUF882 family)